MLGQRFGRSLSLFISLGFSLLIHIFLLWFPFDSGKPISSRRNVSTQAIKFKIISKKPKNKEILIPLKKKRPIKSQSKIRRQQQAKKSHESKKPQANKQGTYERLLFFAPEQNYASTSSGSITDKSLAQVLGGETFHELKLDSDGLRYLISVPYQVRESFSKKVSSRAVVFRLENNLQIKSLSGQPILRACLFESFLNPEAKVYLINIMRHLDVDSINITLNLIPKINLTNGGLAHEYKTSIDPSGLNYDIYFDYTANREGNLADPFVEKDKTWDLEKLRSLKNSVAYKRTIRGYIL